MESIKILATGKYIPQVEITNKYLEAKFQVDENYIYKRTGIQKRYFAKEENIKQLAINAVQNLCKKENINVNEIELIITATTSTENLMPGISNYIQKELQIKKCMCLDILAGCSGFINAFDIASLYIRSGNIKKALVVGVDILSKYTDENDLGTAIILSDGAGAVLLGNSIENKKYISNIECLGENSDILTCKANDKIHMDGIEIYKYAVTETVTNVRQLLNKSNEQIENIKYILPHQSNLKIIKGISNRLKLDMSKMYNNIENIGNTFCASIPIALDDMFEKKLINDGDKMIFLGYGGGLNTGSILIEI